MTEQEYVDTQDLGRVQSARKCLQDIISQNSTVIGDSDLKTTIQVLFNWERRLRDKIKITSE